MIGFTTCIRIRPDFPWHFNNRGVVHHRQNRNDLAVRDYTEAPAINPKYVEAWENRGIAYSVLGKTQEAIDDFGQAIALNPKSVGAYTGRAGVYSARKQYTESVADYDQVIAMSKPNPVAYFGRAVAHHQLQNYLKARDDYSEVIKLVNPKAPAVAVAYANRAIVNWNHLKEFDDALKDSERADAIGSEGRAVLPIDRLHSSGPGQLHRSTRGDPECARTEPGLLRGDLGTAVQIYLWQGKPKEALA